MADLCTSVFCPFCKQHTALQCAPVEVGDGFRSRYVAARWQVNVRDSWWIGVCNYCRNAMLVLNDGEVVYPTPLPDPTDENVPEAIRADLDEAKLCFSVKAFRGCSVLARRAMQSASLEKGAVGNTLQQQVVDLEQKGMITKEVREWADAVRWVGNDAAHPGTDPVTEADADDVLKLAGQFLHVLYVAPAIARAIRGRKNK